MKKIEKYIFIEILKGCSLILFIFLSISWLLQFTRLVSLTNLIQVDILTIFNLSIYLIPNLMMIVIPFSVVFGLIISFLKLHKDKEIISIYSLGLKTNSLIKALLLFSIILISILLFLSLYLSPKIYKEYKVKEFEIRNKIDFEKVVISNFIEINDNTFLDFVKDNKNYKEVFIKFKDNKDNFIYAEEANIDQINNKYIFVLTNGYKITILEKNKIEKLEFKNYQLEIVNNNFKKYDNFDKNTLNIIDDIKTKNYINIINKIADTIMIILIIIFFYYNNIKFYRFNFYNIFKYFIFSTSILIINQILKNLEISYLLNLFIIISIFLLSVFYFLYGKKYA